jgi:hypothetical protein
MQHDRRRYNGTRHTTHDTRHTTHDTPTETALRRATTTHLVHRVVTAVQRRSLSDAPDVPQLHDAVSVTRRDRVAGQGERNAVDGVVVAVERLDARARPGKPNRQNIQVNA